MPRIGVTALHFRMLPHLKEELLAQFPDTKFNESSIKFTEDDLIEFLKDCEIALIGLDKFNDRVLDALPNLKLVCCCSVGADHIDAAAFKKRGVRLSWKGGVNKVSVSELTVSFMVNLIRKVNIYNQMVRKGEWPFDKRGLHLRGRTVGIHGCGNVGQELVRLLQPFGVKILVSDRKEYPEFYKQYGLEAVSAQELRARSEILTLHLPKNSSTIGLYDAKALGEIREGAYLINTSRGGIVDEKPLIELLKSGKIAGAAFDVFAMEPSTALNNELMALPNMLATPHIGGSAIEAWEAMARSGMDGITDNWIPEPGVEPFD